MTEGHIPKRALHSGLFALGYGALDSLRHGKVLCISFTVNQESPIDVAPFGGFKARQRTENYDACIRVGESGEISLKLSQQQDCASARL